MRHRGRHAHRARYRHHQRRILAPLGDRRRRWRLAAFAVASGLFFDTGRPGAVLGCSRPRRYHDDRHRPDRPVLPAAHRRCPPADGAALRSLGRDGAVGQTTVRDRNRRATGGNRRLRRQSSSHRGENGRKGIAHRPSAGSRCPESAGKPRRSRPVSPDLSVRPAQTVCATQQKACIAIDGGRCDRLGHALGSAVRIRAGSTVGSFGRSAVCNPGAMAGLAGNI